MPETKTLDADTRALLASLERGLQQAHNGEFAAIHTPEQLQARRGRPAGSNKLPTTIRIEAEALARWRASGKGWQTRVAALVAANAP